MVLRRALHWEDGTIGAGFVCESDGGEGKSERKKWPERGREGRR